MIFGTNSLHRHLDCDLKAMNVHMTCYFRSFSPVMFYFTYMLVTFGDTFLSMYFDFRETLKTL